jgi:hypothetical protein
MSEVAATVRAFVAESTDGGVRLGMQQMPIQELGPGDVTIRVPWSSVNYKDALATMTDGRVARISPLIPGIDLAGEIVESSVHGFPRDAVGLAHGCDPGVTHHGGFAEYALVPADWIVPCPDGLTPRQAMGLGTADFTAGLSVQFLEERGLRPSDRPVLVTGATGGLGSIASACWPRVATAWSPAPVLTTRLIGFTRSVRPRSSRVRRPQRLPAGRWSPSAGRRSSTRSVVPPSRTSSEHSAVVAPWPPAETLEEGSSAPPCSLSYCGGSVCWESTRSPFPSASGANSGRGSPPTCAPQPWNS